jgi:hypothetical protein
LTAAGRRQGIGFIFAEIRSVIVIGVNGNCLARGEEADQAGSENKMW